MRHPEEQIGEKRICPVTGQRFKQCWTDHDDEPWTPFNRCDSCHKDGQTVAERLAALNEKRKKNT